LVPELRELFLLGCGLHPGGVERVDEGLRRHGNAFSFFDPRLHLARLRAPVFLVHGRDDDVIPWFEAEKIRDALPPDRLRGFLITGMASHTGTRMPAGAFARELLTLMRTVRAIHSAPRLG
jgi:pimeloyl-ACP methyl ester carboxylesterase